MRPSRTRTAWRARLLAVLVLLLPALAHAEVRVLLWLDGSDARRVQAVRGRVIPELELRGFTVALATDAAEAGTLARLRDQGAAMGIVVVLDAKGGASIEVVDRVTGKRVERQVPGTDGEHGASEVALATAELVDASLVELRLPRTVRVGELEPPPELAIPSTRASHPRWQADGSIALLWPVRERAPVSVAVLGLGVRPTARLGLSAEGVVPFHAFARGTPTASLRTYPFFAGARADVALLAPHRLLRLDLQVAVSAIALRLEVDAIAGVIGRPQTTWTAAGQLGLALHRRVGRHGSFGGLVRLVLPFHHVRIDAARRPAQRFDPVWVGAGVSAFARW